MAKNASSLPSTINSSSEQYRRGIESSPPPVKDEAKATQQESAVSVSGAVIALQQMHP